MPSLEGRRACHVALRAVWPRSLISIFRAACRPATSRRSRRCLGEWRGQISCSRGAGRHLVGAALIPITAGGLILASALCGHQIDPARADLVVSSSRMAPRLLWGLEGFGSCVLGGAVQSCTDPHPTTRAQINYRSSTAHICGSTNKTSLVDGRDRFFSWF